MANGITRQVSLLNDNLEFHENLSIDDRKELSRELSCADHTNNRFKMANLSQFAGSRSVIGGHSGTFPILFSLARKILVGRSAMASYNLGALC